MHPAQVVSTACLTTLLAALTLTARPANALTLVPGGTLTTQTWTLAGSPYRVAGDITIPAGVTLTIQPGVSVEFAPTDSLSAGLDVNRCELTVRGTLTALGTTANPIIINYQGVAAIGMWYGIVADTPGATLNLRDLSILSAVSGMRFSASPAISTSRVGLNFCSLGVSTTGNAAPTLDGLSITACTLGVSIASASATLRNCVIADNFDTGVRVSATGAPGTVTLTHCTIINNDNYGVQHTGTSTLNMYNCIVTGNSSRGILRTGTGVASINTCDVWNNNIDYQGAVAGPGCISVNPLLTSGRALSLGSPCIDTADPLHTTSTDQRGNPRPVNGDGVGGAAPDIGAFEYACTGGVSITIQPGPFYSTQEGLPFTMQISAAGSGLTYQWRRAGVPLINSRGLSGANTNTLTVDRSGLYDAGLYDVVVSNGCVTATTTAATLEVTPDDLCASSDFNGDGDYGTDADIEAFFRVLAGGDC